MMAIFLAVANSLMDSGFKQALIRLHWADQIDYNTAFYTNLALGMLSYALLFAVAPFIADFYDQPRLVALIRVAGIAILINSFQIIQSAVLSRNLNFRAQLHATVPAGIISGLIAVGLAYAGFGVWALIAQMLLAAFITTVLLWYLQGWRPSCGFSRKSLSTMYNFGYKLFLSGLLDITFKNIYVMVIAKIFAASIAGYYFFAYKIKDLIISQLVGAIGNVTYPALATMQNDNVRLKAGYRKILQVTTFLLFPAMAFLAALAGPIFRIFLPDKWLPALPYLQLMCIAGFLYPLHSINLNILKVKGRSDLFFYLEIYKKIVAVIILLVSIRYGVTGILIGQIIGSFLSYIPNSYFSSRLISYTIREQMADFLPGLGLSGVIAVSIYAAGLFLNWPASIKLALLALLSSILYLIGAHLFKLPAYIFTRQMLLVRLIRTRNQE